MNAFEPASGRGGIADPSIVMRGSLRTIMRREKTKLLKARKTTSTT